jgi:hypothetical protein
MATNVNVFHAFVVAPTLGYIGYKTVKEEPLPPLLGAVLLLVAILVAVYHLHLYDKKTSVKQEENNPAKSNKEESNKEE